ncbi:MAG: lysophospholipid acyltransferase family protein [Candidatus Paceibacterota bacterium]|jgi:1-acyl-sn-glycerol-3-phosphate acyltransferase
MRIPKGFFLPALFFRIDFFPIITHIFQALYWPFVRVPLVVFGKLVIKGREYIAQNNNGVIFAVNHLSQLDPFIVPATLNPFSSLMPMHYVSRERSYYDVRGIIRYAYGGLVFKIWGAYPALVGIKDYEKMLPHHISLLLRGKSVCIFPEGKLNTGSQLAQGKPGVAYLLWRTGRPVVPVAISGHKRMGPSDFFARKHKIVVSYGKPISREEIFGPDCAERQPSHKELIEATAVIMSRIQELLAPSGYEEAEVNQIPQANVVE